MLHHAILAYCTFGHVDRVHYVLSTAPIVDPQRWIGFDGVVALNDGFFMPLLFLLSGLFVRDGLVRKGPLRFLRGRLLRLGLPFVLAELTVVPLAYYPSFLQARGAPGLVGFWVHTVTAGPWPSGPPWFIGVLLLFDVAAAIVSMLPRRAVPAVGSTGPIGPIRGFLILLAGSVLLYLPLLVAFGPARWIAVGPVAVQASRILLYAAYFAAGVALGAGGLAGIQRFGQSLARQWTGWVGLAFLTAVIFIGTGLAGFALATYCAAMSFAVPALFLRFGGRPGPLWTSLAASSFAIYLLHYPAVTWTQYALLAVPASAVVKALVTFALALGASWLSAALFRRMLLSSRL